MSFSDLWGPLNSPTEPSDSPSAFLPIAIATLFVVEAVVILEFWFWCTTSSDLFAKFGIPIVLLFPGLVSFGTIKRVRRVVRDGDLSPSLGGRIEYALSTILFTTYVAILLLTTVAFR